MLILLLVVLYHSSFPVFLSNLQRYNIYLNFSILYFRLKQKKSEFSLAIFLFNYFAPTELIGFFAVLNAC